MNTHDKALSSAVYAAVERAYDNERSIEDSADEILALIEADRKRRGEPVDKGPWTAGVNKRDGRVYVDSDDFTHDVRLYVDGDFATPREKLAYAKGIAGQLNASPQPAEPTVKESLFVAEPVKPEADHLNLDRLADYIADNWPDKKYGLEEICQRLHATWPTAFMPAEPVKLPSDVWALVEKYADAEVAYNEAVRIDVGIDKAGQECLAAEKELRSLLSNYGNVSKSSEKIDSSGQRVDSVDMGQPVALLSAICDVFHIGSAARTPGVVMANVENAFRRSRCLSAIERVLTVETPPDPDEGDDEPGEECLLRWGAEPEGYAEHFKAALAEWLTAQPQPSGNAGELPQVALPPRPEPAYRHGDIPSFGQIRGDCYAGADVLAYGRACAEAQREADRAALAAQASGQAQQDADDAINAARER